MNQDLHFKNRLTLINHSIYGSYLQKSKFKPLSFYDILNRCLLFTQHKICIVLFKKNSRGYKYCKVDFINDKEHIQNYKSKVNSLLDDASYLKEEYLKDKLSGKEMLFNIYSTGFFFHVFLIHNKQNKIRFDLLNDYKATKRESDIINYIEKSLRTVFIDKNSRIHCGLNYIEFDKDNSDKFNQDVRNSLIELEKINIHNDHLANDSSRQDYIKTNLFDQKERIIRANISIIKSLESERGIFNKLYRKIRNNVLDLNNQIGTEPLEQSIANIIFFRRSYDRSNLRYEINPSNGYNYNVVPIIPKEQELDIIKLIQELIFQKNNTSKNDFKEFCLVDLFFNNNYPKKFLNNLKLIERCFWKKIKINKNKNTDSKQLFEWVMQNIKKIIPDDAQSLADSIMISGLIHFRKPYANGSLIKYTDDNDLYSGKLKDNQIEKYFPMYASSLLIYLLAPIDKKNEKNYNVDDISIVLYPLEVSGRISIVAANILYKKQKEQKIYVQWNKSYYFYNNIILRIQRLLRSISKREYILKICSTLKKTVLQDIKSNILIEETNEVSLLKSSLGKVNKKLKIFSRFVPYNVVQFDLIELEESEQGLHIDDRIYFLNLFEIKLNFLKNPFFLSKNNIHGQVIKSSHIKDDLMLTIQSLEFQIYDFINFDNDD